jgi:hypothetical protein
MSTYDLRCDSCNTVVERKCDYADAERGYCDCGGTQKIIITQVNLSPDATPTRGWGKFSDAPKLVKNDGSEINPGHEPPTTADLRLTPDQVSRLNL